MNPIDMSPALPKEQVQRTDRIVLKWLYYARGVDNKCLVPLITTATICYLTEQDEKNVHQFLDYMATYPNAVVRFHASDIVLSSNTDVSYLIEPQAHSPDT